MYSSVWLLSRIMILTHYLRQKKISTYRKIFSDNVLTSKAVTNPRKILILSDCFSNDIFSHRPSCYSLHKRRKALWGHRKHNWTNLNDSGLKRSEKSRLWCRKAPISFVNKSKAVHSPKCKLNCQSRAVLTWWRRFNWVGQVMRYIWEGRGATGGWASYEKTLFFWFLSMPFRYLLHRRGSCLVVLIVRTIKYSF